MKLLCFVLLWENGIRITYSCHLLHTSAKDVSLTPAYVSPDNMRLLMTASWPRITGTLYEGTRRLAYQIVQGIFPFRLFNCLTSHHLRKFDTLKRVVL